MSDIDLSNEEKERIVRKIQLYFMEKLDQQIGQFDAEFLLDFFSEEVGAYYYIKGMDDAEAELQNRQDDNGAAIDELEKLMEMLR